MKKEQFRFDIHILLIVLLSINVLIGIYIAFIQPDAYALEKLKVGGKENMKMAVELYSSDVYKEEQKNTLTQILASMNQLVPQDQEGSKEVAQLSLDQDMLLAIRQDTYVKGKENARITIIEYSDLICPFCKSHYTDRTIEQVIEQYPNDVNKIFKQFPVLSANSTSALGAQAVLCAGKLGGKDIFYKYLDKAFVLSEYTQENVVALAKELTLNTTRFAACLTDPDTINQVQKEMQEAQSFGITGTPGNVIIDNTNGTYVVIPGAYPVSAFVAEVERMLAQ